MAPIERTQALVVHGALDPDDVGHSFGFLHADPGIGVTQLSGTLLACALASALIAVRGRPGRRPFAGGARWSWRRAFA